MPYVVVQPNDTLAGLSKQNRVPLERLLAVNPQIQDPNRIFPGQIVILPLPHQRNPVSEVQRAVRPGDTMWNIAREFGVPLQQVIRLNPQVNNPDLIYPGMILTIKQGQACPRNVVDFVNRFMENKTGGHYYKPSEYMTAEAEGKIDPRLLTGIKSPYNSDYDFISCYQNNPHEFVSLVALYRRNHGFQGVHDIVLEHIIVTTRDGRPKVADVNVQVVLRVSWA